MGDRRLPSKPNADKAGDTYKEVQLSVIATTVSVLSESVVEAEIRGKKFKESWEALVDLTYPGRSIPKGSLYKHWHMLLKYCLDCLEEADGSLGKSGGAGVDSPFPA